MNDELSPAIGNQPVFRPFNPEGLLEVYVRHLPHWRHPGVTYFVTMRQDDSIPASVVREWHDFKSRWFSAHGLDLAWLRTDCERFAVTYQRIPAAIRQAFEREQARMLHVELDRCHGSCILRHPEPQRIVDESLHFFDKQRLWLGDSVIMPNHVHLIVQPFDGWELEGLLGSIKKWTARCIGEWLSTEPVGIQPLGATHNRHRLWQQESHDHIIRDQEELQTFRKYIADNPQAANCRPGEFLFRPSVGWVSDPTS